MATTHSDNNSFLNIDDDLEGVDDFLGDEPNPFEDPNNVIASDDVSKPTPAAPAATPAPVIASDDANTKQGKLGPGLLNYYSRFFQLDTHELQERLVNGISFRPTMDPMKKVGDLEDDSESAAVMDLYGSVWITASVVMSRFIVVGGLQLVINELVQGKKLGSVEEMRKSEFINLIHSIWIFFGYTFGVPFVSWQLLIRDGSWKKGVALGDVHDLISVYGYGNVVWVPVCMIMAGLDRYGSVSGVIRILEWVTLCFGMCKSGFFIYKMVNFGQEESKVSVSLIVMFCFHVVFSLLIKFIIF
ncbi:hypothetical protein NCAS_0C04270 [Naumovozyma castellii]|uniref:Protein YIP n=1 Tax=Naumovozyma castellii TaxID=27288 RepID=G0VD55_NAUCA|nr:hypothetical protein NCAS_0C04270 [Naumovozyma castellii CBS 4309]CCC69417.1 hypothetical protein NCAS_0C04270 [Naumovozyma castellii CBS 4309]